MYLKVIFEGKNNKVSKKQKVLTQVCGYRGGGPVSLSFTADWLIEL